MGTPCALQREQAATQGPPAALTSTPRPPRTGYDLLNTAITEGRINLPKRPTAPVAQTEDDEDEDT